MLRHGSCMVSNIVRARLWTRIVSANVATNTTESKTSKTPKTHKKTEQDNKTKSAKDVQVMQGKKLKAKLSQLALNEKQKPNDPPTQQDGNMKHKTYKQREILVSNVSQHLVLHQPVDENGQSRYIGTAKRPLVLLFRWLYSTPQALHKYCTMYHDIGLDVLLIKGKLAHFLWPPMGVKLVTEVFDFLKEHRPPDEPLFIHAFSIGAYNYTIAMQEAASKPEFSGNFRKRVVGQIFDSVVMGTYDNMSEGITQILPDNQAFRRVVMSTLHSYYEITQKTTKDTYNHLMQHFKDDPITVPTLVYYSKDDVMCDPVAMEAMLKQWRSTRPDFHVRSVSWARSKHVAHLRMHREEYIAAWLQLMEELQLM